MKHNAIRWSAGLLAVLLMLSLPGCNSGKSTYTPSATPEPEEFAVDTITPSYTFEGGAGTPEDPYRIETAQQLALLSERCSAANTKTGYEDCHACYRLDADIDLNDLSDFASWGENPPKNMWIPIADDSYFQGTFDGNGHTIRGMYIHSSLGNPDSPKNPGLFGRVSSGAVVKILRVEDSLIVVNASSYSVGGIVADAVDSAIQSCESAVPVDIQKAQCVGGVVGTAHGSDASVSGCSYSGELRTASGSAGGVIGSSSVGTVENCTFTGRIVQSDNAETVQDLGGIMATATATEQSTIQGCTSAGELIGTNANIGGVMSRVSFGEVLQFGTEQGTVRLDGVITVSDCVNRSVIRAFGYSNASIGGIAGSLFNSSVKTGETPGNHLCTVRGCVNEGTIETDAIAGGVVGECYCEAEWTVADCKNAGTVHSESYAGGIIGEAYSTARPVTVSGCVNEGAVSSDSSSAGGVIAFCFGGSLIDTKDEAQTLTLSGCRNTGEISGGPSISGIGGIVGSMSGSRASVVIRDCQNDGAIRGASVTRAGGIVGSTYLGFADNYAGAVAVVQSCINTGAVTLGAGDVSVTNDLNRNAEVEGLDLESYKNGSTVYLVMGSNAIGGIVGYAKHTIVEDCVSSGALAVDKNAYVVFTYIDLLAKAAGAEGTTVFCGGVCGVYDYLPSDDPKTNVGSTPDNSAMRNNSYLDSIPLAAFCPYETVGVENNSALPTNRLQSLLSK